MYITYSLLCSLLDVLRVGCISIVREGVLIDSFNVHVHSVVRMRDGMLVDPFELPAVLRGRNYTPLNIAARINPLDCGVLRVKE